MNNGATVGIVHYLFLHTVKTPDVVDRGDEVSLAEG